MQDVCWYGQTYHQDTPSVPPTTTNTHTQTHLPLPPSPPPHPTPPLPTPPHSTPRHPTPLPSPPPPGSERFVNSFSCSVSQEIRAASTRAAAAFMVATGTADRPHGLVAATHHSAQQNAVPRGPKTGTRAREGGVREGHQALRGQTRLPPGKLPPLLVEVRPQGKMVQHSGFSVEVAKWFETHMIQSPRAVSSC